MINFDIEKDLYNKNIMMIGVDEAGRGSWAGPLVATACWFDINKYKLLHPEINDSKRVTPKKRKDIILSLKNFVKYCSSVSSVREIDKYGLSFANTIAIKRSLYSLIKTFNCKKAYSDKNFLVYVDGKYKPDFFNVDNFLKNNKLNLAFFKTYTLIKGDSLSKTIALASIISKEIRDSIMKQYSLKHPFYFFDKHVGYGTAKHKDAIYKNGVLEIHRTSFKPIRTIYCKKK